MTTGTITFFDDEKGVGYVVPTDGSTDIVFTKTGLNETVVVDDAVTFTVQQGKKGLEAINISKL